MKKMNYYETSDATRNRKLSELRDRAGVHRDFLCYRGWSWAESGKWIQLPRLWLIQHLPRRFSLAITPDHFRDFVITWRVNFRAKINPSMWSR